jgi:phosphate transport system permease protein
MKFISLMRKGLTGLFGHMRHQSRQDQIFNVVGLTCTLIGVVTLCALLIDLMVQGFGRIDWQFLTSYPSRHAGQAGILSAIVGSVLIMIVTFFTAVPLGVAAAIYLEEYARKNWLTTLIEINISNLAGVPSIIYGLMALGLLVYYAGLGESILTGGLTLAFLILPIVIVATREALRAIPKDIRVGAFALGSTRWQVVWHHLLPYSVGGIATGVIIAMSRAIGETAPLILIGALAFIAFLPPPPLQAEPPFVNAEWLNSDFTVLPIQMFNWVSRPDPAFLRNAAATGLVLIVMTLSMNAAALVVRHRSRKHIHW